MVRASMPAIEWSRTWRSAPTWRPIALCALHRVLAMGWSAVYLRSGKYLPNTATEILIELKTPPQKLFADAVLPTERPTICASGSLRTRLSLLLLASSSLERSLSESSESFICRKNRRERNRPTNGS